MRCAYILKTNGTLEIDIGRRYFEIVVAVTTAAAIASL